MTEQCPPWWSHVPWLAPGSTLKIPFVTPHRLTLEACYARLASKSQLTPEEIHRAFRHEPEWEQFAVKSLLTDRKPKPARLNHAD